MDEFETAKRSSTAQVLMKCARLVNERAMARLEVPEGAPPVRAAHTALFPHIDFAGTRVTEIAARLGITKQAVTQLANDLEAWGVVARIPDPADGRAKLLVWTERGRAELFRGLETLRSVEEEMAALLGGAELERLHATLLRLQDWLEAEGDAS